MKIKNIFIKLTYIAIITYLFAFIPTIWGNKPLVIISGSMEPTLKVGGLLYYHKQTYSNFKNNDVLVYKSKKHIISHRIVSKSNNLFITKGDANKSIDSSKISMDRVLGKGTNWSIPFLGYYTDFIYRHKYLLFILIVILICDLTNEFYHRKYRTVGDVKLKE